MQNKSYSAINLFIFCLLITIIISFPLLWMILNAFKDSNEIISRPHSLIPLSVSLRNISRLLKETNFIIYFKNSVVVAGSVTIISVISSFLASYVLARIHRKTNSLIVNSTLWAYMISPFMLALPAFVLLNEVGLIETTIGLVLVQVPMAFALSFWIAYPFMKDIPIVLEETAILDGAQFFQVIWHIVIPLLRPAIISAVIFSFVFSWNEYVTARILVSGYRKTLPVGIQDFYESTVVDWSILMTASILFILPILISFVAVQRLFIDDWGAGGIKG